MSLLGRLEDLSLTDIIQIVFLSRRTGVLEIIDHEGRHTVLFRHGMIVNASAPSSPDLASFLRANDLIDEKALALVRQTEEAGVPSGDAVLEMNLLSKEALANAITQRIAGVVVPLLSSRDGEFNFILSESVGKTDTEYDVDKVLPQGGVEPQKIFGGDGEKIKPLRGLEESMKAGKALLRGTAVTPAEPEKLDIGLGQPPAESEESPVVAPESEAAPFPTENVVPFPVDQPGFDPLDDTGSSLVALLESEANPPSVASPPPAAEPVPAKQQKERTSFAKFSTGRGAAEGPADEDYRNVILFERDPLLRVAVRRAFNRKHVNSFQFGTIDDTRAAMDDLLSANRFFVTFLDLDARDGRHDRDSISLLQMIKRRNRRLPVVVVDRQADLKRRHFLLAEGADLYLTKPSPAHLQPGLVEEQLALFADEFVLFSDNAFEEWLESRGDAEPLALSEEEIQRDRVERGTALARQLINELSNPNDVRELSHTILRLAEEYLERAVLFAAAVDFTGLGGFGLTGGGDEMNQRARKIRISRSGDSVLSEVAKTHRAHRGKLRRTPGNVELIDRLGKALPTSVVVLPIVNRDRVVGVLYGDNAESRGAIGDTNSLELFLLQSGFAFENALIAMSRRADSSQDSR